MLGASVFYHLIQDFDISSYWKTGPCLKGMESTGMIDFILNSCQQPSKASKHCFGKIGLNFYMKQLFFLLNRKIDWGA